MAHDDPDTVPSTPDDATEAVWRQRFADHAASGLSVRDWCRQHDIPERQFHRRRLKVLGPRRTPAAPRPAATQPTTTPRPTGPTPAFVPLHLAAEPTADIALPSGVVVTVPLTADPSHVARLVAAVRSC
jgi:hypothetical protein